MKRAVFILFFLVSFFGLDTALAQEEPKYPRDLSWRYTLRTWKDRVFFQMADREHNTFRDFGTLQRYSNLMDQEYTLDLRSYDYSMQSDFLWHLKPDGVRLKAGSVSKRELINYAEFKKEIQVTRDSYVNLRFYRHEDLSARRNLLDITWEDRHVLKTNWFAYWNLLPGIEKIDDDMEFGTGYRFGPDKYFKISVALLDVFNNFINNTVTVENQADYESKRDYKRALIMGRLEVIWPFLSTWRAEGFGGATTRSRFDLIFIDPTLNYIQKDEMYYAGALLEKRIKDDITAGIYSNFERAVMHRNYMDVSLDQDDIFMYETTYRGGIYLMANPFTRHYIEAKAEYVEMPEVRDFPNDPSQNIDHRDREIFFSVEDYWAIRDKVNAVAGYFMLDKDSGVLTRSSITSTQHRFKMAVEYYFNDISYISLNVNLDLDIGIISYDGGSIRLVHYF